MTRIDFRTGALKDAPKHIYIYIYICICTYIYIYILAVLHVERPEDKCETKQTTITCSICLRKLRDNLGPIGP